MSRIGKCPIAVPAEVSFSCKENVLTFRKGEIFSEYKVPLFLDVDINGLSIVLKPKTSQRQDIALWGTTRKNIDNIVVGLTVGFVINLELIGVGYKAAISGKNLVLQLGYSHDIIYNIPDGVSISCLKPTTIAISGASKKQVGDVAAVLKGYRKVEPYKGKGIVKFGDFVYRKEGKKK